MFTYQNTYQCCTLDESISRFYEEIAIRLKTEMKTSLTLHRGVMELYAYIGFKNDKVLDIKIELNKKKLMWVCICEELDKEDLLESIHKEMLLDKEGSSANSRGRLFGFRAERFLRDIAL
ncbi:TPA: hypothetical protein QCY49_000690 [Bacillus paranthracis]|nr:hypothetical protein [Bacillus paranthracis]